MRSWMLLSATLVTAGVALFLYKVFVLHYPLSTAERGGTWRVEFVINVTGKGARAVVAALLPRTSDYQRLLSEEVRSGPLRFSITADGDSRLGRWSGKLSRSTSLSYQVTFDSTGYQRQLPQTDTQETYPKRVRPFLQESPGVQTSDAAIADLCRELRLNDTDKASLARDIYAFVSREIGSLRTAGPMDAVSVIREGRGNVLGRARLFCALARFNHLPCRVVPGLLLSAGTSDSLHYWNEVYVGSAWVPFDVVERQSEAIAAGRLALSTGFATFVEATGTGAVSYRFEMQPELETYLDLMARRLAESHTALDRFSLLLLPVQVQRNLRILLLVPLGAFAMCILRSIVGLRTFGMFMPMLIALALTATGLLWGTTFLATVIGVALLSRLWIQRLYLLLVARIAFILTVVVGLMVFLMFVGDRLGAPTTAVGAFPFVIMTMIVERISVSLEEEGWRNTLHRVGTTVLSIYLTYAVVQARMLQTFLLVFPECLLVILGLLVAVGRYTGYRLTELARFRDLARAPGSGDIRP